MPFYHQGKKVKNAWYGGRKVKSAWYGGKKVYASTIVVSGSKNNAYLLPLDYTTVKTVTVPDGRTTCEATITLQNVSSKLITVSLESSRRGKLAQDNTNDGTVRIEGTYDVTPGEVLKIRLGSLSPFTSTTTWRFEFS